MKPIFRFIQAYPRAYCKGMLSLLFRTPCPQVSRIMVTNTAKEGEEAIRKVEAAAQEKYSKLEGEYMNINAQRRDLEVSID